MDTGDIAYRKTLGVSDALPVGMQDTGRWTGRAVALLSIAGVLWWSSNVAFVQLGITADGWNGPHSMWEQGFSQFPLWIKQIYATIGGPLVALVFLGIAFVVAWRGWYLALVATLAIGAAIVCAMTAATASITKRLASGRFHANTAHPPRASRPIAPSNHSARSSTVTHSWAAGTSGSPSPVTAATATSGAAST